MTAARIKVITMSRISNVVFCIDLTVAVVFAPSAGARAVGGDDEIVVFNTNTLKYHCVKREWALKCTRNCIELKKSKAKESGGVPCKVCGGTCAPLEGATGTDPAAGDQS